MFMTKYSIDLCDSSLTTNSNNLDALFTYSHTSMLSKSYIDFILLSKSASSALYNYLILDFPLNLSDHLPVCLQLSMSWVMLNVDLNEIDEPVVNKNVQKLSCLRWDHADLSVYCEQTRINIAPKLDSIDTYCATMISNNNLHYHVEGVTCNVCSFDKWNASQTIDNWYSLLVDALSHAAIASVPSMKRKTLKYWWSQEAMVFKQNAIESHRVWK